MMNTADIIRYRHALPPPMHQPSPEPYLHHCPQWNPASALERVRLPGQERTPVHTLSGGEKQRVALTRLLLKPSRIILADEPTASLNQDNEDLVLNLLQDLANEGKVILLATHSDRVASRCSRMLSLHHHSLPDRLTPRDRRTRSQYPRPRAADSGGQVPGHC